MLNLIINTTKESNQINLWQIATPIITAITSLGAVYFGAWLTDKRHQKEEQRNNINKMVMLHTLLELQIPALVDYKNQILTRKLNAISIGNISVATEKYPFSSWLLPINIKEYDFLINIEKGALSALNQVIKYEEQLNSTINIFDNFTLTEEEQKAPNRMTIYALKIKSIIETLNETCNSLIFFSLILHRYLSFVLTDIYKEKIYLSDQLMAIDIKQQAQNDKIKLGWLRLLPTDWQCSKYPKENL